MRNLLETDGYKFSMAEAGFPLRIETFYYSHRRGGPQILPVDVGRFIRELLPDANDPEAYAYLDNNSYSMCIGFREAMKRKQQLVVDALPMGSVFFPGEPVFSVTGPSALVSWLEPLLLQLNYRIQVATAAILRPKEASHELEAVTCPEQWEIVQQTYDYIKKPMGIRPTRTCDYINRVRAVVDSLTRMMDPERIFEVGLRSATCMEQHLLALEACRAGGITRTSNVYGARQLHMKAVGTMGHEHVQRWRSDEEAFRAMSDRRPYRSSYLLDTFSTVQSGIPAALRVMAEFPDRGDSIRYDSGNKIDQLKFAASEAGKMGLHPIHILEDGLDLDLTRELEKTRLEVGVMREHQHYGYGGFIVANPAFGIFTRDRVAATFKLSRTGPWDTMKFSDDPGKVSLPGRPVVFRRIEGSGPIGIIAQFHEPCPPGYVRETGSDRPHLTFQNLDGSEARVFHSPATTEIMRNRKAVDRP